MVFGMLTFSGASGRIDSGPSGAWGDPKGLLSDIPSRQARCGFSLARSVIGRRLAAPTP